MGAAATFERAHPADLGDEGDRARVGPVRVDRHVGGTQLGGQLLPGSLGRRGEG